MRYFNPHSYLPLTMIYVEDEYNHIFNKDIQSNYLYITELFEQEGIHFIYIPYLIKEKSFQEIINYNRPYLQNEQVVKQLRKIYAKLKKRLRKRIKGEALIWTSDKTRLTQKMEGLALHKEQNVIDQILETFEKIKPSIISEKSYSKRVFSNSFSNKLFEFFEDDSKIEIPEEIKSADETFDYEAYKLADEIREKIRQLKETGAIHLLTGIFEEVLAIKHKLSTLYITNDFRIFLQDYEMKEVVLAPLPKALFFLFLHHPKGIPFKHIADYHDELLSIYKNVTVHEDMDRAMVSIKAMTDPLNNSINEKCSRIRAGFLDVVADEIAMNYYITGERGKSKKITLNRSMVIYQE